ncbi:MAG: (Fe-S)-binding protein, partial [Candidatus Altiarchaeota archaeon]|nr:(Fe-S)-binding protein [Candidatus Altiarchaeota archaeon]
MARLTALQLYRYLPAKNCGKCGESTCMAFAMKLIEREKVAPDCTELTKEGL